MNNSVKKRILVSYDWFHPGYKAGGPIQSCHNFVYAMRDQFEIFVITGDRDFKEESPYPNIPIGEWIEFAEGIQIKYCNRKDINLSFWKNEIKFISPDFIYLNNLFSPHFSILPLIAKRFSRINTNWILAPRGALRVSALAFKPLKKKIYLKVLRYMGFSKNIRFQTTDEQEAKDVQKYFGQKAAIFPAQNFPYARMSEWEMRKKEAGKLDAVFFARISPIKKLHYLVSILTEVDAEIKLDIIGPVEDAAYWEECQKLSKQFSPKVQMNYLGEFPHQEIMKRLKQYHIFCLPTSGENFGHAIFEAMAAGCPVLISDQTPWRNLAEKKVGWDVDLKDREKFKQSLETALAMEQAEWETWSRSSWNFCKDYLIHSQTKEQYMALFSN